MSALSRAAVKEWPLMRPGPDDVGRVDEQHAPHIAPEGFVLAVSHVDRRRW
jgi:hypothetical protein